MLRFVWTMTVVVVLVLVLAPLTMVAHLLRRDSNFIITAGRIWSRAAIRATGARVEYHGLERLVAHQPCIYIANHQSNLDIWVLLMVLPETTRFACTTQAIQPPLGVGNTRGRHGWDPRRQRTLDANS